MSIVRALPLALLLVVVAGAQEPVAPAAKKVPHELKLHGDTRVDDYFWLKEKKNPDVIKHLEAENAYTAAMTARLQPLRETLYKEMVGRVRETDRSVPYREDNHWYYTRTEAGKQYPIHCRKKASLRAAEEVLIDENELAKGEKFLDVGEREVSDDGNLLAYTVDVTGFREYDLFVKDLRTGELLERKHVKTPGVAWAADGRTLFYLTEDAAKRAHKVWRHVVGEPREKDVLVYEEKDELFWLGLGRSSDRKFLFHVSISYTGTEQRYLPANLPKTEWKTLLPRSPKHEYMADHRDGEWLIRTNRDAVNFRIVTCPAGDTDPAKWRDLVPHDPGTLVEGLTLFRDFAVVSEREGARPQHRVIDLRTGAAYRIEHPGEVYDATLAENAERDATTVRLRYSSPTVPPSVYEYDLATGARKLLKRSSVPGGFDPSNYETGRTFATAPDGKSVPVSYVHKKGLKRDGSAACLLYGYGSYGATTDTDFDQTVISLLDRGVIFAWAHIRGSSDLGRAWYDDGKMLNKQNTFSDFIACADHLVKEQYCDRARLAINGASAGGLLVGAVLNKRPDLCRAAVLDVPFVDAVTTMCDETLPLTIQEFDQWGNPKKKDHYDYMRQYDPYANIKQAAYPAVLVTTSLNDSQVMYHEPAKYVARLRELKTGSNPVLLKCDMDAGHGGASGRYDALKEKAFTYAFLLDALQAK